MSTPTPATTSAAVPGMAPQPSWTNTNSSQPVAPVEETSNVDNPTSSSSNADAAEEDAFKASKVLNLKFVNATSFVLTAMMVIGVVLFGVREEGIFGDEFLWMKYQTLLTPANYVTFIWIPIFVFQGLFIYASTKHPTLQSSPLVGYNFATSGLGKRSVAVHYPAICATTLMMIYSQDYEYIGCALLSSVLCVAVLANVIRIQGELLDEMEGKSTNLDETHDSSLYNDMKDEDEENPNVLTIPDSIKTKALQYFALRFPFELSAGYVLTLAALYLNMFLDGFDSLPSLVDLIVANVSLVGLLAAGSLLLWKIPERKFYGVGISLVWYLLGVAIELHSPTQPIYNQFSDMAILVTQIVALIAATVLMTMLGVRVMKTMINYNIFNCARRLGGDQSVATEDDEISTGYVHA